MQGGLRLDLNVLVRQKAIGLGESSGLISWRNSYDEIVASGLISMGMEGERCGWLRIQIRALDRRSGVPDWGEGDESDYPPKPKWMRWRTYNGLLTRIDRYDQISNESLIAAMHRILNMS